LNQAQQAGGLLLRLGAEGESLEWDKAPLSMAEIEVLIGRRDYKPFLKYAERSVSRAKDRRETAFAE